MVGLRIQKRSTIYYDVQQDMDFYFGKYLTLNDLQKKGPYPIFSCSVSCEYFSDVEYECNGNPNIFPFFSTFGVAYIWIIIKNYFYRNRVGTEVFCTKYRTTYIYT